MDIMSRINPYTRLQTTCRNWAFSVLYPKRKVLFRYDDATKSGNSWRLDDLCQRVIAADTLDFDVRLRVENKQLIAEYVKRPDNTPWEISV